MRGDTVAAMFATMDAGQIAQFIPTDVLSVVNQWSASDYQYLDADSANAVVDSIGFDEFLNVNGDKIAGIMGALDEAQVSQFDSDQLFNALTEMDNPGTFAYLSPGSALAMYEGIVFDPANDMDAMRAAGLFGAMDPVDITRGTHFASDEVFAVFNNIGFEQAADMRGDTLAAMLGAMDPEQIAVSVPTDVLTVVNQMEGQHFAFMDADSAFATYLNLTQDQHGELLQGQLAGMFGAMNASDIGDLPGNQIIDALSKIESDDFQFLDSESALAMYTDVGQDLALGLEGGQLAGLFAAMDGEEIQVFEGSEIFQVASAMGGEGVRLLDSDSAFGVFNGMGLDQSLILDTDLLAGLVNVFDPPQFEELGGDQVVQVVGALNEEDLAGLGNEQALGIATSLDLGHFGEVEPSRLFGLTTAIEANDIDKLGSDVLTVIAEKIDVDDLATLHTELAGAIFELVSDGAIGSFTDDRVEATLVALGADFFGAGATDFEGIASGTTVFDQVDFESPESLLDLVGAGVGESLFGGNLFGG